MFIKPETVIFEKQTNTIFLKGTCDAGAARKLFLFLEHLPKNVSYTIDFKNITSLSMSYAAVLLQFQKKSAQTPPHFLNISSTASKIIDLTSKTFPLIPSEKKPPHFFVLFFGAIGQYISQIFQSFIEVLEFLGICLVGFWRAIFHPREVLMPNVVIHIERAGITAIPIIVLTSFVVGVVLSYEGALQLSKFGARMVTIDLLSYSVLREVGVLITAVVIAGRSGSAFAAEIGTMKVNEEIDALKIMGMAPIYTLVVPRILALIIFLPVLTLIADFVGLFGGALICYAVLDINFEFFVLHLQTIMKPMTFWIGLLKAPLFGLIIGLVGCMEGMKVENNAESVGIHTTKSVVTSIFLVIIVNGIVSVLCSYLGV